MNKIIQIIAALGAGSQTFDVQTTLKPSSVEITYKGWHKHTPKECDNGSWS